jgi:hypothetical protein
MGCRRDVDYGDVEEDQELVRVFTTFEESGVEYVVRADLTLGERINHGFAVIMNDESSNIIRVIILYPNEPSFGH